MFLRIAKIIVLSILLSFFVFPISFTFLPETLNSKIILAAFGILAFVYECIRKHAVHISRITVISTLLAVFFSIWCLYCITKNGTDDTIYSRYWLSYATWLGGGYAACFLIKNFHGKIDLEILTFYLTMVCLFQCVSALLIDNIPSFQRMVDRIFVQTTGFFLRINRMYGIGAALDTAGVRFSVILVLMAHQMSTYGRVMEDTGLTIFYFVSYAFILVVGSIISRTTWVGASMGLGYMIVSYMGVRHGFVSSKQTGFWLKLVVFSVMAVFISVWLYNHNASFHQNLRFGFEGFFNWIETGSFRTASTDKLNQTMWIWPSDTRTWIIGTGLFGNWIFGTDIGYCRFCLYCGLVGMVLFSLFFVYNGISLYRLFDGITYLPVFLIALTFIVWMKVSTDIYFIYALLFSTYSLSQGAEIPCESSVT